jgi:bacterioferritin-associated ferredoxin
MYVCYCNEVTEREIRQAAAAGVRTMAELSRRTGCSTGCGGCAELAEAILDDALGRRKFSLPLVQAA